MKTTSGRKLILTAAILGLLPTLGLAQDYFRTGGLSGSVGQFTTPLMASDMPFLETSNGLEPNLVENPNGNIDTSNFAIGPIRFSMAAGVGVEFNDNITLADEARESDVIIRPSATVDAFWQVTDLNTLRLSLGISYAKYINNSQYDTDGVLISPLSELEFKFSLGQVQFRLHDRFSYQQDPYNVGTISNVAQYSRYENEAGIDASYDFNSRLRVEAAYQHYNLWTTEDVFSQQDRSIDTITVRPSYELAPGLRLGLRGSVSWIDFSENRGDGYNVLVGPYLEWAPTQNTTVYLEGGYQLLKLDGQNETVFYDELLKQVDDDFADAVRDSADNTGGGGGSSYYVRLDVENRPWDTFRHRISLSKTQEIGFFSDTYDLYHAEYGAEWTGIQKLEIGPTLFYEYYTTDGGLDEEAQRFGAALSARYHLTDAITLGADYRFLLKESDVEGADYYQNLAFLSIYYKF